MSLDPGADNVYGYAAPIWSRFARPAHAGALSGDGVVRAEAGSPAARSVLRLAARVAGGRILEARFQAYGCPTAIAVGEWAAAWLEEQGAVASVVPGAAQIRARLEIPEDRAHCALMGEDVLRALLQQVSSR